MKPSSLLDPKAEKRKRETLARSNEPLKRTQTTDEYEAPLLVIQVTDETKIDGKEYKRPFPIVLFGLQEETGGIIPMDHQVTSSVSLFRQYRTRNPCNYTTNITDVRNAIQKEYPLEIAQRRVLDQLWVMFLHLCVNKDEIKNDKLEFARRDSDISGRIQAWIVLDPQTRFLYALWDPGDRFEDSPCYNPLTGSLLNRDLDIL